MLSYKKEYDQNPAEEPRDTSISERGPTGGRGHSNGGRLLRCFSSFFTSQCHDLSCYSLVNLKKLAVWPMAGVHPARPKQHCPLT